MDQQLPGLRASCTFAGWNAEWIPGEGWRMSHWHRHQGEPAMCRVTERYSGLTLEELQQIIEDQVLQLNTRQT